MSGVGNSISTDVHFSTTKCSLAITWPITTLHLLPTVPLSLGTKITHIYKCHFSQRGKICSLSTPDGQNSGFVQNPAIQRLVSTRLHQRFLDKLLDCGIEKLITHTSTLLYGNDNVMLHEDYIGSSGNFVSYV